MSAVPTMVSLTLEDSASMSFSGPFACVPEALHVAACVLDGWSKTASQRPADLDVVLEFDYGDYVYHECHSLIAPRDGGVARMLLVIDADLRDWMTSELPRQIVARAMLAQAYDGGAD